MSEIYLPVLGTIGDLANATTATLMESACAVLGYASNADGGEGIFTVGASAATNYGTVINDLSGRTWYRETGGQPLSVKWFGAVGNGVADDTNSIQYALNAIGAVSGSVYFPAGTYMISSTLSVPYGQLENDSAIGGIKIFGDGLGISAIENCVDSFYVLYHPVRELRIQSHG